VPRAHVANEPIEPWVPVGQDAQLCSGGIIVIGSANCPATPAAGASSAPGAAGAAGAAGTDGAPAGSGLSSCVEIPAVGGDAATFYAGPVGVVNPAGTYTAAETATASKATTVSNAVVKLVGTPAAKLPTLVVASLITSVDTPQASAGTCSFDPETETKSKFAAPIAVPANSTMAWQISLVKTDDPVHGNAWEAFSLSLGATSRLN
jgi:hypothetical protein